MQIRMILRNLKFDSVEKFLTLLLSLSLILLGDLFLIVFFAVVGNVYVILSIVCFLTFLSFIIARFVLKKSLENLTAGLNSGAVPNEEFAIFFGELLGSVFFIVPGFISFIIGAFLLYRNFAKKIGSKLIVYLGINVTELYEYIKLYEIKI